jgi:hypothetical protein
MVWHGRIDLQEKRARYKKFSPRVSGTLVSDAMLIFEEE